MSEWRGYYRQGNAKVRGTGFTMKAKCPCSVIADVDTTVEKSVPHPCGDPDHWTVFIDTRKGEGEDE